MSKLNQATHTDALDTLGTILEKDAEHGRDAIHIAVVPAIASEWLVSGQRVNIENGQAFPDISGNAVVDPFLENPVNTGERFWAMLMPRTITGLRHVWSHPDFPEEEDTSVLELKNTVENLKTILANFSLAASGKQPKAKPTTIAEYEEAIEELKREKINSVNDPDVRWLMNFAHSYDVDYEELMSHADSFQRWGDYWSEGGRFEGTYVPEEFWDHYDTVKGTTSEDRGNFFSCSC